MTTSDLSKVVGALPFSCVIASDYSTDGDAVLRAALQTTEDVGVWLQAFAVATNTHWNVRKTYPSATNFLLRKDFVCHHSSFMKVLPTRTDGPQLRNNRGRSKNTCCSASLMIKVYFGTSRETHAKVIPKFL